MTISIDYVSPLPPVRSGISDYSVDLFPELSRRCDLRLIRLPGQEVDDDVRARWPVVEANRLGEDGRLPMYHMGNNHHHQAVWDMAVEKPGVLVLHDLVLHHFLIERTVKDGHFDAYTEALDLAHGWLGRRAAAHVRRSGVVGNATQFALTAHRELLTRQKGILTHSGWAQEMLLEEIPELRIQRLSMGMPLPEAATAAQADDFKTRYGLPLDRPILGSFGFQTPIKRTEVVVRALAEPGLENTHLMVAGEVAPILQLDEIARELGVADRVHVLGFLPFEDFEAGIAAADIALNLRYPTAGETSASLLRILAVGRPVLVSDYAQSADLPDSVVLKAPLGDDEPRQLAARVSKLLADPEALSDMGRRAHDYVAESHRLDQAAQDMVDACARWQHLDPPDFADEFPRPTSLAWNAMHGELDVIGADEPWSPGERRHLTIRLTNNSPAVWLAGERLGGGIALQIKLLVDGEDLKADEPWIGLPEDLPPGEQHIFKIKLRRPLQESVRLEIVPHALEHTALRDLEGPFWAKKI